MAGPANASGPIVCTACRPIVVTEGPTSLEVGTVNIDGAHPDWMVTGYSYLPGKTFTVKIENATSGHVYDSTTAMSQSNGTFGALSPVNPEKLEPEAPRPFIWIAYPAAAHLRCQPPCSGVVPEHRHQRDDHPPGLLAAAPTEVRPGRPGTGTPLRTLPSTATGAFSRAWRSSATPPTWSHETPDGRVSRGGIGQWVSPGGSRRDPPDWSAYGSDPLLTER